MEQFHMRDMKRLNADADERDETRIMNLITLFYICVLVAFIIVY